MQVLVFLFLCLVWGTTWLAIKVTLEGFPPFIGAAMRFIVAVSLLLLYAYFRRISLRLNRQTFRIIFISAFLMYVFDYGLVYWGEQYVSAGITAIFFATFPLFTGIWSNFLFREERFRWNRFLGLVLGLSGVVIVFVDQLFRTPFHEQVILATIAITLGAAGGAMSIIIVKKYLPHVNAVSLTFHQMLLGLFFLLLIGIAVEDLQRIHLNERVIWAILYLGAVGSALAFALYYWLLKKVSAITLSLIIYITPIVAVIADYFFFGEVIYFRTMVGTAVIFAGITLNQFDLQTWQRLRIHWRQQRER